MKKLFKKMTAFLLAVSVVLTICPAGVMAQETAAPVSVEAIVSGMSLDEKISQMIIPAIRTWNGTNVQDLNKAEGLAEALQRHQYGGIILYGANVADTEQITRLVSDLQKNNAQIKASTNIPYLMPLDAEGGIVNRLVMGTRMTGNMAIGATGSNAEANALKTGEILGEELAALGFHADFAPDIDVNSNPANPVIGTRSFSDDPDIVSALGLDYSAGLANRNIIATYKHYPGHGDTSTDTHLGIATVNKTLEELKETELVPFEAVIKNGADMIMTAHITFPKIDDEQVFPNGSRGYFPATMSKKMITEILREGMGYDGVIITDALEMDALKEVFLKPGEKSDLNFYLYVAEKVINAGVDILLLPNDFNATSKIELYDQYVDGLEDKVNTGVISEARINESVTRILKLKEKYGILTMDTSGKNIEEQVKNAKKIVGSASHHAEEMRIAKQAVTLVRNENKTLPIDGKKKLKLVFTGRNEVDAQYMRYAANHLIGQGLIPEDSYIVELNKGTTTGSPDSNVKITIDFYMNVYDKKPEFQAAVKEADAVITVSNSGGLTDISNTSPQYVGMEALRKDVQANKGAFIVLSNNLPYDSARYQNADAIAIAYMWAALRTDPTDRESGSVKAYNANMLAAFEMIFGGYAPAGKLPVVVPVIAEKESGEIYFSDETLYERGFGLSFTIPVSQTTVSVSPESAKYTGKEIEPKVTVKNGKTKLTENTDYTLSYSNNKNAGTAVITIKGKGNYTGSLKKTFKITKAVNPMRVSPASKTYRKSTLSKGAQRFSIRVTKAQGNVTVKPNAAAKKAGIRVTGRKVTVSAKCPKGSYKIIVKASGTANYKAGSKTVTVRVR